MNVILCARVTRVGGNVSIVRLCLPMKGCWCFVNEHNEYSSFHKETPQEASEELLRRFSPPNFIVDVLLPDVTHAEVTDLFTHIDSTGKNTLYNLARVEGGWTYEREFKERMPWIVERPEYATALMAQEIHCMKNITFN